VKINPSALEPAKGLRFGIVPTRGDHDSPFKDDERNLVVCPLPWDGDFMDIFYRAWWAVLYFIEADAREPRAGRLPYPAQRQIVQLLEAHRDAPVLEVIEALE
jgi:hypothetical protein